MEKGADRKSSVATMLARQMRRAARSTPCNIAEALSVFASDPVQAIRHARGAQREVQCFIKLSRELLEKSKEALKKG